MASSPPPTPSPRTDHRGEGAPEISTPNAQRLYAFLNTLGLFAVLIALFAFFSFKVPGFYAPQNLETLAKQAAIVSMAVLGMTFVIVCGGIDLSIGSVVACSSVMVATMLKAQGENAAIWAILAGIGTGMAAGLLNGLLITRLRVAPFIVTLGSLLIIRGAAHGIAREQGVYPDRTWMSGILAGLKPEQKWMLFPPGVWATVLFIILAAILLKYTAFGRSIRAVGGNETAARYSGLRVDRIKLAAYVLMGLFAGLAGILMFSRLSVGDPTSALGLELDVIAAAVIGGASLSGGQGSIMGSILGALIMTILRSGLSQMGLSNWVEQMITGGVIILAVAIDRFRSIRG